MAHRDARQTLRLDVRLHAALREPGSSYKFEIDVIDLSITGLRLETSFTLQQGARVFVTFPKMHSLEATVKWKRGFVYGLRFDRPLHSAVFDHIVAQYRRVD